MNYMNSWLMEMLKSCMNQSDSPEKSPGNHEFPYQNATQKGPCSDTETKHIKLASRTYPTTPHAKSMISP